MLLHQDARVVRVVLEVIEPRELRVHLLVGADLLVGRQPDLLAIGFAGERAPRLLRVVAEAHRSAAHVDEAADVLSRAQAAGDLQQRDLAHPEDEEIGRAIGEDGVADPVAPVVVVRQPPQRSLDSADHHRHVREQFPEAACVHGRRVVGSPARGGARRVRVARAPLLRGGVVIDHRVHVAARHAEEEPGAAAGREVLGEARLVPAGLGDDPHLEASRQKHAPEQRYAEGGVVDVGIAVHQHDVELIPSAGARLGQVGGQERLHARPARPGAGTLPTDPDECGHRAGLTPGCMCVNPAARAHRTSAR